MLWYFLRYMSPHSVHDVLENHLLCIFPGHLKSLTGAWERDGSVDPTRGYKFVLSPGWVAQLPVTQALGNLMPSGLPGTWTHVAYTQKQTHTCIRRKILKKSSVHLLYIKLCPDYNDEIVIHNWAR